MVRRRRSRRRSLGRGSEAVAVPRAPGAERQRGRGVLVVPPGEAEGEAPPTRPRYALGRRRRSPRRQVVAPAPLGPRAPRPPACRRRRRRWRTPADRRPVAAFVERQKRAPCTPRARCRRRRDRPSTSPMSRRELVGKRSQTIAASGSSPRRRRGHGRAVGGAGVGLPSGPPSPACRRSRRRSPRRRRPPRRASRPRRAREPTCRRRREAAARSHLPS